MSSSELKAVYCCTYRTSTDTPWKSADWVASKGVKLLKGDEINGYFEITINRKLVRITNENASVWVEGSVPRRMAKYLKTSYPGRLTLVPIPNSQVTSAAHREFKTLELAERIAEIAGADYDVCPALVFREPQVSSRKGGPRSPYHFEQVYRLSETPKRPVVLIDDVMTGGGHLIGAVWKLAAKRIEVVGALTFGRAVSESPEEVFRLHEERLNVTKSRPSF